MNSMKNKTLLSIGILWLVHLSAIIGISLGHSEWFVTKTPYNLLVIFLLIIVNFPMNTPRKWGLFLVFFLTGYVAEWLGVHYGLLFGDYAYGENLGWKIQDVPVMIGINWAVLVMVTGAMATAVFSTRISRIFGGAALMVFLDLFMEVVAPAFDFWQFSSGEAPAQNYIAWFGISALLHTLYQKFAVAGNVVFSLHVYGAQCIFFIYFFLQYGL